MSTCTHFVGIGGIGMSGLAQLLRWSGSRVTGSDRDYDRGIAAELFRKLRALGVN